MRICARCKESKPYDEFHNDTKRKGGKNVYCKVCWSWFNRKIHLRRKYGISIEDYDLMFEMQNGVCYICKKPETRMGRNGKTPMQLSVDHNHNTGAVRRLLCDDCNNGIARFHENEELLLSAIAYLKEFNPGTITLPVLELPR